MKARYYVARENGNWVVVDRTLLRMHNDIVATFESRKAARERAHTLNIQALPQEAEHAAR